MTSTHLGSLLLAAAAFFPLVSSAADDQASQQYIAGVKYQRNSAEIKALQLQTYHFATLTLEQLAHKKHRKPLAVVVDLDETVLDNSELFANDLKKNVKYSSWDDWDNWEKQGSPTLIPGAKGFLDKARALKVKVFYVSDRSQQNQSYTVATLQKLQLPDVSDDTVLLAGPSKETRRQHVLEKYDIAMLLGDSLPDFSALFYKKEVGDQINSVKQHAGDFGTKWFVFPNAAYGSWEKTGL